MIKHADRRVPPFRTRLLIAIGAGLLATLGLNVLAFVADNYDFASISNALIWPNTLLQSLTPAQNIGTAAKPVFEGTPLNFLAFVASIPFAWLIYSSLAYLYLSIRDAGR